MVLPVRHRFLVLCPVHGDAAPALLLSQGVPHHRDGLHGHFMALVLGLDADDAPLRGGKRSVDGSGVVPWRESDDDEVMAVSLANALSLCRARARAGACEWE